MKRTVKNYNDFINEDVEVMPDVKPRTKPKTSPNRPSPLRRSKPGVDVKPKATAEEVADKFLDMIKDNSDIQDLLKNKYDN